MVTRVFHYSIVFITALFFVGKMISTNNNVTETSREDIKNRFSFLCVAFVIWSLTIVTIGIAQNSIVDHIFILLSDFFHIAVLVTEVELFALLTDNSINVSAKTASISSALLYFGVFTLAVRMFLESGAVYDGAFSSFYEMNNIISIILTTLFQVVVLFFYAAYTYMYWYTCTKKREYFISNMCMVVVGVFVVCLSIETFFYIHSKEFIPLMYFGALVSILLLKRIVDYKRSIELNPDDYMNVLAPSYRKPAFVCNDEGRIVFENTRAFVMQQTYKDDYSDKLLTDIFDITDYDQDRLKDSRVRQSFDVYCKYPKSDKEILLKVKHNLDKYGSIFTTEIEVEENTEDTAEYNTLAGKNNSDINTVTGNATSISHDVINDIRTEQLIKQIEYQKALFESGRKDLFIMNMKGISKAASVLGLSSLEDLCDRIQTEIAYGEWEYLDSMIIELDRQYETLKIIRF